MKTINNKKTVCIFCSSSSNLKSQILTQSSKFAEQLAKEGFNLIYGGTSSGLMKLVADTHKKAGGRLIGVIPEYMIKKGIAHNNLDELISVKDLYTRKKTMIEESDIIATLPGGIGTYDEFFEIIVLKQLKQCNKPLYLMNFDNFFDPLVKMLKHGVEQKTIALTSMDLFTVCNSFEDFISDTSKSNIIKNAD